MKINIKDNDNFGFLRRWQPRLLKKLLTVFEIIESHLPFNMANPDIVSIDMKEFENETLTAQDVLEILCQMRDEWRIIKEFKYSKKNQYSTTPEVIVLLDLNPPAPKRFYNFGEALRRPIKNDGPLMSKKDEEFAFEELYLNAVGDLWREPEPKTKYVYPMIEKSNRHKIVRYLATNRGYQQASQISSVLEGTSEQTIRQEKRKINDNFREFLKIKKDELIEGRKGSGYRINPKYKIILRKSG